MPIVFEDDENQPVTGPIGVLPETPPEATLGFFRDVIPAAFSQDNLIGSAMVRESGIPTAAVRDEIDPDFNPFADIAGFEDAAERFAFANTDAEVQAIKRQIDMEREDQAVIARAGWPGMAATAVAGTLDLTTLLPGAVAVRGLTAGGTFIKSGLRTATAAAPAITLQEGLLQSTQETRTAEESGLAIGIGTIFAGVLGGFAPGVRHLMERQAISRGVTRAETSPETGTQAQTTAIALGDLQEGLDKVFVAQGRGQRIGPDDVGVVTRDQQTGEITGGALDLDFDSGLVKVVWKHGSKSTERPEYQVTRRDLVDMPTIFRRLQPTEATEGPNGRQKWTWVAERDIGNGPQQVVYVVKEMLDIENKPGHLVTVHVLRKERGKFQTSPTRKAFAKGQKELKDKDAFEAGVSGTGLRHSQDTNEGVSNSLPSGPASKAPSGDSIAPDSANLNRAAADPFAAQTRVWDDVMDKAEKELTGTEPDAPDPLEEGIFEQSADDLASDTSAKSAGAAATLNTTLAEEGLKSALGLEKVLKFQDPLLRLSTSVSIAARRTIQRLAESPLRYAKNDLGIPTAKGGSVETRIKMRQAGLYRALAALDQAFQRHRMGGNMFNNLPWIKTSDLVGKRPEGMLGYSEFKARVSAAMRRGDADPEFPEVAEAARAFRQNVFDPLKDDAIELGLLPEDVDVATADSYLMRSYNVEKIAAQRDDFVRTSLDWMKAERDRAGSDALDLAQDLDRVQFELDQARAEKRRVLGAQRRTERETRDKKIRAEERLKAGQKATRQAETGVRQSARRVDELKARTPDISDYKVVYKDLTGKRNKPQSLLAWLKASGGVQDQGGELKAMGIDSKSNPGLISGKGRTLDDAANAAWEEGFLLGSERPPIDELLDAMRDDFEGSGRIIRANDQDLADYDAYLVALDDWLGEIGFDFTKHKADDLAATMQAGRLKRASNKKATKAKTREAQRFNRQDLRRLRQADIRTLNAEDRLALARDDWQAARDGRADARARVQDLDRRIREAEKARKDLRKTKDQAEWRAGFDDLELEDIAQQLTDRIMGSPAGRLPYDVTADAPRRGGGRQRPDVSGPLKGRSFNIPDELIEPWLENDIEVVARLYDRTMAPDVELIRAFGSVDMVDQLDTIRRDYADKVRAATTEAERAKLKKRMDRDMGDIIAVRDRLRGTYALPQTENGALFLRGARVVKQWNYLRLLGGMTISAIPDVFRTTMVHGVGRTFGDGIKPLMSNLKGFKLAAEEVKLAGTALDMVLDSRAMAIADLIDDYGRYSAAERGLTGLTNRFGLVSLMAPWNAFWKQFAGTVTQARMLDAVQSWSWGTISPDDISRLAAGNIDEGLAKRIAAQFAEHGQTIDGMKIANTLAWTDRGAVDAFRGALVREVDRIIVTPGQDKPLWMSTSLGSVVGQFKSFQMAATQRVLMAGLQDRDASALSGLLGMTAAGMGVYWLKSELSGRETSDDMAVWLREGIDRAGVTGWAFDANNMLEKATRGGAGLSALTGGPPMSRYASRNAMGALLGPTFGTAEDFLRVTGSVGADDWKQSDTRALRRLLPLQNVFWIRTALDQAEDGVNETLGVRR